MKVYNIYYKNEKINSRPLKETDLEDMLKKQYILKKIDNYNSEKILLKDTKIIKCTLI